MSEDEPFLRAILTNPDDRVSRLVYADWLDERDDPKAEFIRLEAQLAELSPGHKETQVLRQRRRELQAQLPAWWLAILGGLRATRSVPDPARVGAVTEMLGRPVQFVDDKGYTITITAAATSGFTDAVAYLEERSQWRRRRWADPFEWESDFHDIHYYLRIRGKDGREVAWEPKTYNPFFGCDVQFMEWYGDAVLFIYEEKHDVYVSRFGLNEPARFHAIGDNWILDGCQLAHVGYRTEVQRLSIPDLKELPPLSEAEAIQLDLLPTRPGE